MLTLHQPRVSVSRLRHGRIPLALALFVAATAVPRVACAEDEPEEPDFAFIAGGPYTQKAKSTQFISASQYGRRRSNLGGSTLEHAEYGTLLRNEWGLTDRWELDIIFAAEGGRDRLGQTVLDSSFALGDSVLGIRYRFLQESRAPFTLTMGPQLIFPTGSILSGTSHDRVGLAWDVAAAKDWGGPIFLYTSLNYAFFPSVRLPRPAPQTPGNLHDLFWGTALGLRPLEKDHGSSHHDLHAFLELGVGMEQDLTADPAVRLVTDVHTLLAPGIRYGLLKSNNDLYEIGVSFPVGLDHGTPRYGIILQIQFEHVFRFGADRR
ncbi:MAG: hypothetical protein ACE145_03715 [Terriglobia bacterium]